MQRAIQFALATFVAAVVVVPPFAYWRYTQSNLRAFRVVRDGVLYRSGQMTAAGLRRAAHDYGFKTVITLRDATYDDGEAVSPAEEQFCQHYDIRHVRIPPRNWEAPDGSVPAEAGVRTFLEVMDDPANYPVLIHCLAGIHRTGAYCAIYRMEYEHWSNQDAMAEMRTCGYDNLDWDIDICNYLETYRPRWDGGPDRPMLAAVKKGEVKTSKHRKHKAKKVPG